MSTAHDDDLTGSDEDRSPATWDDRPMFGTAHGLPWWGAVLLGFGLSLFGAAIDLQLNDKPTLLTKGTYLVACLTAAVLVQRKSLFTTMVQPPLIFAVVMPIGVISAKGLPETFGLREVVLNYGVPVINGFPIMAIATAGAIAIGVARYFMQRSPDDAGPSDYRARRTPRPTDYPDAAQAPRSSRGESSRPAAPRSQQTEGRRSQPVEREPAPERRPTTRSPRPSEPSPRTPPAPPPGSRFGEPLRRQPPPGQPPRRPGFLGDEPPSGTTRRRPPPPTGRAPRDQRGL